jgi:hypothetical protein
MFLLFNSDAEEQGVSGVTEGEWDEAICKK